LKKCDKFLPRFLQKKRDKNLSHFFKKSYPKLSDRALELLEKQTNLQILRCTSGSNKA
jgi:hypothetical protein